MEREPLEIPSNPQRRKDLIRILRLEDVLRQFFQEGKYPQVTSFFELNTDDDRNVPVVGFSKRLGFCIGNSAISVMEAIKEIRGTKYLGQPAYGMDEFLKYFMPDHLAIWSEETRQIMSSIMDFVNQPITEDDLAQLPAKLKASYQRTAEALIEQAEQQKND